MNPLALTVEPQVKYDVMETWLATRIDRVREQEVSLLRKQAYLNAANRFINFASPLLVAVVVFTTFVLLGNQLTAGDVFSSLALFGLLRQYLSWFPRGIAVLTQCLVSQRRISSFLCEPELAVADGSTKSGNGVEAVVLGKNSVGGLITCERATFCHGPKTKACLSDVSVRAGPGELCVILGAVGSGKTSLLQGLLGELRTVGGATHQRGTVALCQQQPWIQAGSLRDNILFGTPFEGARYWAAVRACALEPDLQNLPYGDQTMIGEKGVTVSGGQKARIALARAVYRDADLILLDDILAAVDVHVGRHLMAECICGILRGKTRILVTNSLSVLEFADRIYCLDGGTVVEEGTYTSLIGGGSAVSKMIQDHAEEHHTKQQQHNDDDRAPTPGTKPQPGSPTAALPEALAVQQTQTEEARQVGHVRLDVYLQYFRAGGSVQYVCALVLGGWLLPQVAATIGEWWLAQWTVEMSQSLTDGESSTAEGVSPARVPPRMEENRSDGSGGGDGASTPMTTNGPDEVQSSSGTDMLQFYGGIYVCMNLVSMFLVLARAVAWARFTVRASRNLHAKLVQCVLRLPMSFFETVPLGRILNRFTSDIENCDSSLDGQLSMALEGALKLLTTLALASYVLPLVIIPVMVIASQYARIAQYFRVSVRELKRLSSTSRSPIFAFFSESLVGRPTIRAFGDHDRCMETHIALFQQHTRAWLCLQGEP